MPNFVAVAKTSDLSPGSCKTVEASGKPIALFNVGGTFYAVDNTCLHRGGPLGEGELEGTVVTCPWHGWRWDVTSGVCAMNSTLKLQSFPCKVEGDEVLIGL